MQISTNRFYDSTTSLMQQLAARADTLNTQIATQKKNAAPSDDVVSYQRLSTLHRAASDATAYTANLGVAKSVLQQSDSTLASVSGDLQQAAELAVQVNAGTLSQDQRSAIATQLRSIVTDLAALANTKDSRGQPVFGGTSGTAPVTLDANNAYVLDATTPATIPIDDGVSVQPNENATRVFGGLTTASGATDMMTMLSKLADAIDAGGASTTVTQASDDINGAISQIANVRGSLGARAARVDLVESRATDAATTREADRSSLEDTDVPSAVTELQKTMTILQATQASFTKLSSLSLFDYLR